MKKKFLLFASFLCGGILLSGCVQEETKQDTTTTAEVQLMEAVDSSQIEKETEETVPTESTPPQEKQEIVQKKSPKKIILNDYKNMAKPMLTLEISTSVMRN